MGEGSPSTIGRVEMGRRGGGEEQVGHNKFASIWSRSSSSRISSTRVTVTKRREVSQKCNHSFTEESRE
jgi:hypothetical protein